MTSLGRKLAAAAAFSLCALLGGCSSSNSVNTTPGVPAVTLSATSLTFPNTLVGTTSALQGVTVTNSGTGALSITGNTTTGANPTSFSTSSTSTCGSTLAAGASCTISISFSPSTTGALSATFSLADNATTSPQTIALSGTGVSPIVSFSPTTLAFPGTAPNVTSAPLTTTLTNNGTGSLTGISVAAPTGANASNFKVSYDGCSNTTVAVNGTCSISVTFTPTSATATYTASIVVTDSAASSPQTITLTGSGGTPTATLSPTTLAFGNDLVGSTVLLPVTLTNTGTATLVISQYVLSGSSAYTISSNSCPTNGLLSDAASSTPQNPSSCQIYINFAPTAVATSFPGTLTVTDNAASSPQTATLTASSTTEPNSCTTLDTTSPVQPTPTPNYPGTAFTGKVLAGTTPVVGASVQLYAAGNTGVGSTPISLGTAVTTTSSGAFSIPSSFTCPYNNSVLYVVARGGQVGTNAANPGIVLGGVIGTCSSLTGAPVFTINEATTATLAWSMAQFLAAGGKIGSTSTNSTGIVLAAGTFANLVNISTGAAPGAQFPSNGTAPVAKIDQLADLLNACTSSTGNSSTACAQLYSLTTTSSLTPANTLDAAMNLVQNPGVNVAALYTLSQTSTAFSPTLTAAPSDWTLFINFTGGGMSDPSAVSIDSVGRVWVASYNESTSFFANTGAPIYPQGVGGNSLYNSYGGNVDVQDFMWITNEQGGSTGLGTVTLISSYSTSPAVYQADGLNFPISISFDTSGDAWIANYGDSTVTVLADSNGAPISGASGYPDFQFQFPVAIATDSKCNAYIANQSSNTITFMSLNGAISGSYTTGEGASNVAVDETGNIWTANYYGNSIGLVTPAGKILSGTNGYTSGGINHPQGLAIDGKGNAWIGNYRSPSSVGDAISELSGSTSTTPGTALSPSIGLGTDANMLELYGLAIDPSGNIWASSFATNILTEFVGLAAPVKTPLLGPVRVP